MAGPTGGGSGGGGGGSPTTPDPRSARELTDALKASQAAAAAVTKSFDDQLKIILQMRDAMSQIAGQLEKLDQSKGTGPLSPQNLNQVSKSLKGTGDQAKKTTTLLQKMADFVKSPFTRAFLVAQGAVTGLWQGFKNLAAITKSVTSFFGSIVGGAFKVAKAIISVPFKLMEGLFDMAQKGGGGNELASAYEEVREQFGSLKSESSKTVIGMAQDAMKLNEAGLTGYKVYGNLAQAMQELNKTAAAMGPLFQTFQGEMQQNGLHIDLMRKGLGITDEQMQSLAQTALRTGKKIADVEINMTKQAYGMAKAFGLNAKVLSKDMAKAMQDTAHFGHLSTKEMAIAATYANKLGVSVEKLTGIMDATSTFDQAAEGMSKLNQTFGTNIDATKMMMAQSPAEKLEILRKEFARTGKDMSKLTYQERMLIKQNTNMDDSMLDAAFSAKNAGVSLDKISKQGDKNEKKTMNQAEAMHELADAVKRLTPSGDAGSGGFLKHILDGFSKGIQSSPEFIRIMKNIRVVLNEATMFGVKMGRKFVELFPGVKKMFQGLGDLFEPARYRKMFNDVLKAFDIFKNGGVDSMDKFMDKLKSIFFDFFDKGSPAGKKVLDGFKEFGQAVLKVLGALAKWAIDKLAGIIEDIVEWIKKPKMPDIGGATDGLGKAIAGPFDGALKSLSDKLWPAIKDLFSVIWDKMKKAITDMSPTAKLAIGGTLAAVVLGPAIGGALSGLVSGGLLKGAASKLGGAAAAAAGDAQAATQAAAQGASLTQSPSSMISAALPDEDTMKKMESAGSSRVNWPKVTEILLGMAVLFTIGMFAFQKAIDIVKGVDLADIGKAGLVFAEISFLMPVMAFAMQMLAKIESGPDLKTMGVLLTAIGGFMLIGIGGFSLGVYAVKSMKMTMEDIGVTTALLLAMIPVIAATGLLVAEAKLVGTVVKEAAKEVLVGMGVMALVLTAIVGAAWGIGAITKSIGANEMQAGAQMMEVMSNTFMKVGVIIGEAALVGAAITMTAGIGGALIAAGMITMTAAVAVIAGAAGDIVTQINKMQGDPATFKARAEGFSAILTAVTGMMSQVTEIIKSMDLASFTSQESKIQMMNSVKDMIQSLLNGSDGHGGINGIIEKIVLGIAILTPDKLESVKAFASVMTAVSSMMSAAGKNVGDLQKNATGWFTTAEEDQAAVKNALNSGGKYIETVMKSSGDLIDRVIKSISEVKDPDKFSKAGSAVASILQAVTSMVTSMTPDISKFQKSTEVSGGYSFLGMGGNAGAKTAEVDTAAIAAMSGYIGGLFDKLGEVLPTLVKGIMSGAADGLLKLDKRRLESLPVVGELLKSVAGIVSSISSAVKSGPPVDPAAAKQSSQAASVITAQVPDIAKMMEDIGKAAPKLIGHLLELTNLVPNAKGFNDKVKVVTDLFGLITNIIGAVGKAVDPSAVTQVPGEGTVNSILLALRDVDVLLWGFRYNWKDGSKESIKNIVGHLNALTSAIPDPKFGEKAKTLADVFESIDKIIRATQILPNVKSEAGAVESPINDILVSLKNVDTVMKTLVTDTVFSSITENMKLIHENFSTKSKGAENASKSLESFVKPMKSVIDAISDVPTVEVQSISTAWESVKNALDATKDKVPPAAQSLNELMDALGSTSDNTQKASKLGVHMAAFNRLAGSIAKSMVNLPKSIETIAEAMVDVPNDAMQVAIVEFSDTVKAIQHMDNLMSRLPKVNLAAKVGAMAGKLGLGSSGVYTVKSKDVVINVNFEITMDAGNVEKAIITRTSSVIRDRINLLMENGSDDVKKKSGAMIKQSGEQGVNAATSQP